MDSKHIVDQMILAIEDRDMDLLKTFFNRKAWDEIDTPSVPLSRCCNRGDYYGAKYCIEEQAQDVNEMERFGSAPLHYAKQPDIARLLCENGADPNLKSIITDATPLHGISTDDCMETMKVLIDYGADPEIKDLFGKTAYDYMSDSTAKTIKRYVVAVKSKRNAEMKPFIDRIETLEKRLQQLERVVQMDYSKQ